MVATPKVANSSVNRALWECAKESQLPLVRVLLEHGADPNYAFNGISLLQVACNIGKPGKEMVSLLVDSGANLNVLVSSTIKRKISPLIWAIRFEYLDLVRKMLSKGADVNGGDEKDETPLLWSTWSAHDEISHALLDAGTEVNVAGGTEKMTPLMHSINGSSLGVIKRLLDMGANPNDCNYIGLTPLHFACEHKSLATEIVSLLLDHGAYPMIGGLDGSYLVSRAIPSKRAKLASIFNAWQDAQERIDSDLPFRFNVTITIAAE